MEYLKNINKIQTYPLVNHDFPYETMNLGGTLW